MSTFFVVFITFFAIALCQDFGMDDMMDMGGMGGMPGMGGMGGMGGPPPSPPGIIDLDRFSFNKVVDGSHNVLVLFDDGYSGGGEEWESFGWKVSDAPNIMLATVSLQSGSDYDEYDMYGQGGMDNSDESGLKMSLFEEYGISTSDAPVFLLFLKGKDAVNPIKYDSTKDGSIKEWIESNGVYLGTDGCLQEFDELIDEFVNFESKRDEIGKKSKEFMQKYDENDQKYKSAKYYIKVMAKIVSKSKEWVQSESDRLMKILRSGNLSRSKEKWFVKRLNILSVFNEIITANDQKEEL